MKCDWPGCQKVGLLGRGKYTWCLDHYHLDVQTHPRVVRTPGVAG